jgi:SAM-dependent methyltransferase
MPAPHWLFRFLYDRESAAWERRRNEPEHRELVERTAGELANVVAPPGPVADLGCGPGAHALALARRGYHVTGIDGSPRMVQAARRRAALEEAGASFDVHDVCAPLRFADASLGGGPGDPGPAVPPASPGLHRRDPALPAAGRVPADHRSGPRQHAAHVPEPVLAAARRVLPARARRRPLLRHGLPHPPGPGPGPDRHRVHGRARPRKRAGSLMTSPAECALQRRIAGAQNNVRQPGRADTLNRRSGRSCSRAPATQCHHRWSWPARDIRSGRLWCRCLCYRIGHVIGHSVPCDLEYWRGRPFGEPVIEALGWGGCVELHDIERLLWRFADLIGWAPL